MEANIPIIDLTNSSNCFVPWPASSRIIPVPVTVQNPCKRSLQPIVQNIGSSSGNIEILTPFLNRRRNTILNTKAPTIENQFHPPSVGQVQPPAPDQPNCPICKETFSEIKAAQRALMTTRCGHIFCATCLEMVKKSKTLQCPTCRKKMLWSACHPIYL